MAFFAFDVLRIDDQDLRRRRWIERELQLRRLITAWFKMADANIRYLRHRFDLQEVFQMVESLHGEGVILKQINSPYEHNRIG